MPWRRFAASADVDAGHVHQFAQLLEAELDVAACHERAHGKAGRSLHDARCDGIGDAPALEQADKVHTARTRRIPDAAGAQDGVANCRLTRDVGSHRAGGYRYRDGGTSEISSTPRIDAAAGCQLLDHIGCQHDEVERFTIVDPAGRINATHRNDSDRLP